MRNFPEQAKQALRLYLERGEKALQLAASGDHASLEEALRWRTAAFHNFRVADTLAQEAGEDIARDSMVRVLMGRIHEVDSELGRVLAELAQRAKLEIRRVSAARQKLSRYRSKLMGHSTFTHSV